MIRFYNNYKLEYKLLLSCFDLSCLIKLRSVDILSSSSNSSTKFKCSEFESFRILSDLSFDAIDLLFIELSAISLYPSINSGFNVELLLECSIY